MAKTPNITSRPTNALFWNIWGSRHPDALNAFLRNCFDDGLELALLTEVTDTPFDAVVPLVHTSTRPQEPPSFLDGLARIKHDLPKDIMVRYDAHERRNWDCRVNPDVSIPDVGFGSALLYNRRTIKVIETGMKPILNGNLWGLRPRMLQWIVFQKGSLMYLVAHLHGAWIENNTKGDHAARLHQSAQVTLELAWLKRYLDVDKVIFGGDLNLDITTKALEMLESGESVTPALRLRNLVREFDIISTRTPQYRSYHTDGASHYADYVLVDSMVSVHDFQVVNRTLISDHAPLLLKFS